MIDVERDGQVENPVSGERAKAFAMRVWHHAKALEDYEDAVGKNHTAKSFRKLVAAELVMEVDDLYASLRAELARLTAENERLKRDSNVSLLRERQYERVNDQLQQQLATLTERLAAAERLVEASTRWEFVSATNQYKQVIFSKADDGQISVGFIHAGGIHWRKESYKDVNAAYQAATAQGWLPQDEKGAG